VGLSVVTVGRLTSVHFRPVDVRHQSQRRFPIHHAQKLVESRILGLIDKELALSDLNTFQLCYPVVEFRFFNVLLELL